MRRRLPFPCGLAACVVLGSAGAAPANAQASLSSSVVGDSGVMAPAERARSDSLVSTGPAPADSTTAGPLVSRMLVGIQAGGEEDTPADTGQVRPRAIEYSEGYGRRLAIHRVASYAELPLFATEFILGEKILSDERNGTRAPGGLRSAHTIAAGGLGVLFAVNTVTGVWNLVEARHDPAGRTRRTIHSIGMLLADAGFVWTATLAGDARRSDAAANRHRNAAIASISVATASTLMMWLWKN